MAQAATAATASSDATGELDLCDAILGNSPPLVDYWLHTEGRCPNHLPKLSLFDDVHKNGIVDESERILGENAAYKCTPLHVAILNAYHNGRNDGIAQHQRAGALEIIELLLQAGADTKATCDKVLFCNVGDLNISSPGAPLDPIALALSLKKVKQQSVHAEERVDMMDRVLEKLVKYKKLQQRDGSNICTTVKIPTLVAQTYRDLCLSSDYSDITIVCLDGTTFPAHCNVLATSSPVFRAAIPKDGTNRMVMSRSPVICKAVLTFLYTGNLNADLLESETAALLSVAAEYQLESLQQACAVKCGERLTVHNVRLMLDIGHRHDAQWILKECMDFLQRQPLPVVLGHPKLLSLATENPKLWQQVLMAVGGQYQEDLMEQEEEQAAADMVVVPTEAPSASTSTST